MDKDAKIKVLEKFAQTGYVSPVLLDVGTRAGAYLREKIKKALPVVRTLEGEARYWDRPGEEFESDPYYYNILVSGANAGGKGWKGWSELPFGVLAKGKNRKLFRNGDIKGIKSEIKDALKNGLHPRVFGHSWGAADVARMAKDYPDVPFYAMDPVSWTGRLSSLPKNLTIYRPKDVNNAVIERSVASRLAPKLGGRWPKITKGEGKTVEYDGGHVEGVDRVINKINNLERIRRRGLAAKGNADSKPIPAAASSFNIHSRMFGIPVSGNIMEWLN